MQNSSSILLISVLISMLAGATTYSTNAAAQISGGPSAQQVSFQVGAAAGAVILEGGEATALMLEKQPGPVPAACAEGAPVLGTTCIQTLLPSDYTVGRPFVLFGDTVDEYGALVEEYGGQLVGFVHGVANNLVDTVLEVMDTLFGN